MQGGTVFSLLGAATVAKEEREKNDFYATDKRAIGHLYSKMPFLKQHTKIVEPCAGDGTMGDEIFKISGIKPDMYDIISRREDIIEKNYFENDIKDKYDLIITNPPYKKDTKDKPGLTSLILKALDDVMPNGYVCMLLKTLHLESKERYNKIYKQYPFSYIYVYAPRISCYRNNDLSYSQGAISYSWYVWYKRPDGTFENKPPQLYWIEEL